MAKPRSKISVRYYAGDNIEIYVGVVGSVNEDLDKLASRCNRRVNQALQKSASSEGIPVEDVSYNVILSFDGCSLEGGNLVFEFDVSSIDFVDCQLADISIELPPMYALDRDVHFSWTGRGEWTSRWPFPGWPYANTYVGGESVMGGTFEEALDLHGVIIRPEKQPFEYGEA